MFFNKKRSNLTVFWFLLSLLSMVLLVSAAFLFAPYLRGVFFELGGSESYKIENWSSYSDLLSLFLGVPTALAGSLVAIVLASKALEISRNEERHNTQVYVDEHIDQTSSVFVNVADAARKYIYSVDRMVSAYVNALSDDAEGLTYLEKTSEECFERAFKMIAAYRQIFSSSLTKDMAKEALASASKREDVDLGFIFKLESSLEKTKSTDFSDNLKALLPLEGNVPFEALIASKYNYSVAEHIVKVLSFIDMLYREGGDNRDFSKSKRVSLLEIIEQEPSLELSCKVFYLLYHYGKVNPDCGVLLETIGVYNGEIYGFDKKCEIRLGCFSEEYDKIFGYFDSIACCELKKLDDKQRRKVIATYYRNKFNSVNVIKLGAAMIDYELCSRLKARRSGFNSEINLDAWSYGFFIRANGKDYSPALSVNRKREMISCFVETERPFGFDIFNEFMSLFVVLPNRSNIKASFLRFLEVAEEKKGQDVREKALEKRVRQLDFSEYIPSEWRLFAESSLINEKQGFYSQVFSKINPSLEQSRREWRKEILFQRWCQAEAVVESLAIS